MISLNEYIKESLLDMEDPDEDLLKYSALKELVKKFLQYKCKLNNRDKNSIGFIFNKKYTHDDWKKIVKEFESELIEIGFEYEKDSGIMKSGSLKIHYDDFSFKVDQLEINIDMSYLYRLAIVTDINYMSHNSEVPEHGVIQFYSFGKRGSEYIKMLKKELS